MCGKSGRGMKLTLAVLFGYLLGSIPTALLITRWARGINILEHGSGNPGASNVYRLLGLRWALAVLAIDMLKGYIPVKIAGILADHITVGIIAPSTDVVMAWIGFGAFAGHVSSAFIRFRGGKGTAVMMGALFALAPQAMSLTICVYFSALAIWRVFSLASLFAGASFPIMLYFREGNHDLTIFMWSMIVPLLLLFTHRYNLYRLLQKQELPMRSDKGL